MEEGANTILLRTGEFRVEDLKPKYLKKELEIFQVYNNQWNFEDVLL